MTIFGFLLTTIQWPGWTSFFIPAGWVLLSCTLPFILRRELLRWNPFFLYACLSLMWSVVFAQGVYDLWKLAILSGAFILGSITSNTRLLYVGMAYGLSVSFALALAQWWTGSGILYTGEGQYSSPAGLFFNPNVFGETAALISIALLAHGVFWPLLWTVPSVLLSESRTAFATLLLVGAAWSANRYITVLLGIMIVGFIFVKPLDGIEYRGEIWRSATAGLTWFGRGAGSYVITSPVFSPFHTEVMPNREEDAHNDFLELVYQYGLGTLLLVPVLAVGLFGPASPDRYLFVAFCLIACFNFPLNVPIEGFLGAFALGRLWRDRSLAWDFCLRCGYAERSRLATAEVRPC